MITDSDIKKLLKAVVTKQDLKETRNDLVQKFMQVFATKQDLEQLRSEMVTKTEFKERTSWLMEKLDVIYGEVKQTRENDVVYAEVHRNIKEDVDGLEDRVDRLEQTA